MADHTPGPWHEDGGCEMFINNEWTAICEDEDGGPGNVVAYTHPTNAQLIEAAPNMLASLQYVAWCFDGFPLNYDSEGDECEAIMTAKGLADIRKAIAQATGEPIGVADERLPASNSQAPLAFCKRFVAACENETLIDDIYDIEKSAIRAIASATLCRRK